MEPMVTKERLPKFLLVNAIPEKMPFNRFLNEPWKKGELVKVAPFEEQCRNSRYDDRFQYVRPNNNPASFRHRFVKVFRKDAAGQFTIQYVARWEFFEPLKPKKK